MTSIKRFLIVAAALALGACSFDVVNPGPVGDASLNDPGAYSAIVRGAQYNLSRALSINAFYSAVAAKEYSTSGRVNATKLPNKQGQLEVDEVSNSTWNWSQAARWQAEDGARRLQDTLGAAAFATNRFGGQLLMYAALANRMLGDNFCDGVIDASARQSNSVYYQRADSEATEAIAVATAAADVPTRNAAYAIRAAARLARGQYASANTDALNAFAQAANLMAPFDQSLQNLIVFENDFAIGGNFRATSTWRSFFEGYYRVSGDQRVRWDSSIVGTAPNTTARPGEDAAVKWFYPRKYIPTGTAADYATSMRLVNGREMQLIIAEVALRNNDLPTAMTAINGLRTSSAAGVRAGSPPLVAWPGVVTIADGWNALRKEKSIELWLEARTMGDLRRWIADGTYGSFFTVTPQGAGNTGSPDDMSDRVRLCLPTPRGERNTNPNIPDDPTLDPDPRNPIFTTAFVAVW